MYLIKFLLLALWGKVLVGEHECSFSFVSSDLLWEGEAASDEASALDAASFMSSTRLQLEGL